jgi:hypothetical protein
VTVAKVNFINAQEQYNLTNLGAEYNSLAAEAGLGNSSPFPASFPSVELSAYIASAADKYGVNLVSLNPEGAVGQETFGGTQYTQYDIIVQVAGSTQAMDSFLSYLEAGPFLSLSLENASFTSSGGTFTVVILAQS